MVLSREETRGGSGGAGHTDGLGKQSKKKQGKLNNETSRRSNFMRKKASGRNRLIPGQLG